MTILNDLWQMIKDFALESGIAQFFTVDGGWKSAIMLAIAVALTNSFCMFSTLQRPYLAILSAQTSIFLLYFARANIRQ